MSGYAKYTLNPLAHAVYGGDHETIGLFTDAAAILNLVDVRSIVRCPGSNRSVFTRAFRAKRELQCLFLGKEAIIFTSKQGTTIFFFPLQSFSRKT